MEVRVLSLFKKKQSTLHVRIFSLFIPVAEYFFSNLHYYEPHVSSCPFARRSKTRSVYEVPKDAT